MSVNDDGEKRKAPPMRNNDGGAPSPTDKRQKTNEPAETALSFLLDTGPEMLRKMYSFLTLKETLILRRTHRQFNESSNDIYQYCFIMNHDALEKRGLGNSDRDNYLEKQRLELCSISNAENMSALIRNVTLDSVLFGRFLEDYVNCSKTDNGQAVTILLQDGKFKVGVEQYEQSLRKGFTAMAAAFQQDERVKKDIQMCPACSNNIGCHCCTNNNSCVRGTEPRYCPKCIINDNRCCRSCKYYLCPACFTAESFDACEKCFDFQCRDELLCRVYEEEFIIICDRCDRKKCKPCIKEDGGVWFELKNGDLLCRNCASTIDDKDEHHEAFERFQRKLEQKLPP